MYMNLSKIGLSVFFLIIVNFLISPLSSDETSPGTFSDLELHVISQKIPRHHWEELGLRLGFTGVQLQCVRADNTHESPQRAIYDMLHQWKQINSGGEEQREVLVQALLDTRLKEVAESITDGEIMLFINNLIDLM